MKSDAQTLDLHCTQVFAEMWSHGLHGYFGRAGGAELEVAVIMENKVTYLNSEQMNAAKFRSKKY